MKNVADKQIYPMISEKSWWQLRNQFKKTIPSVVNVSYLKSLLSLNSDQSARNILAPLRQMGIIDADGKPQPRATDWRSDAKYPDVCSAIIAEIYPQELLDLFPDTQVDNATAKSWFMDTCSLGDNAAGKITSTFSMLKSGQIKADADVTKTTTAPKKAKTNKPQKSVLADNGVNEARFSNIFIEKRASSCPQSLEKSRLFSYPLLMSEGENSQNVKRIFLRKVVI